jgi:hypothetical protein
MSDQKELEKTLARLTRNADFVEWLVLLREMREAAIDGMEGATTEKLHQIAGAVAVYNAILNNAKAYAALQHRDKKLE